MSDPETGPGREAPADGATTATGGTPVAVDVSGDRRVRVVWVVFLAGPVIWLVHFMLVYLLVEAACTGGGPGLELFDPPVSHIVTVVATLAAAGACLGCGAWAYRRWRAREPVVEGSERVERAERAGWVEDPDPGGTLAFAGLLLSSLSFMAVLWVGLPALFLPGC